MKNLYKLIFIYALLLCFGIKGSYAMDAADFVFGGSQDGTMSAPAACSSQGVFTDSRVVVNSSGLDCNTAVINSVSQSFSDEITAAHGASCTLGFSCNYQSSTEIPTSVLVVICCSDSTYQHQLNTVESDTKISTILTGVTMGNERSTAEAFCNTWVAGLPSVTTSDGFVRTDALGGVSYMESIGQDGTSYSLAVDCWTRAGEMKASGSPVPMEGVGVGTGGGITQAQAQQAMQDALAWGKNNGVFGSGSGPLYCCSDPQYTSQMDCANNNKVWSICGSGINSGGGGSGNNNGLTQEQTSAAVQTGVSNAFGTTVGTGPDGTPLDVDSESTWPHQSDLGTPVNVLNQGTIMDKVNGFLASNPVMTMFQSASLTTADTSCTIQGVSVFGGSVGMDFCPLGSLLGPAGNMVLFAATLYSLFIALGRA